MGKQTTTSTAGKSAEWVRLTDEVREQIDAYRAAVLTLSGQSLTRSAVIRHVLQSSEATKLMQRTVKKKATTARRPPLRDDVRETISALNTKRRMEARGEKEVPT